MNLHDGIVAGCVSVLTVLLVACEMPREVRPSAAAKPAPGPQPAGKLLDPADPLLDLEEEELKVWWRQDIGQIGEGQELKEIYLVENLLLAETRDGTLYHFNASNGILTGSTRLKSGLLAAPALQGDELYAVTGRNLLVIDRQTGLRKKRLPVQTPVSCQPVPYGDILILGGGNGDVEALDLLAGVHVWSCSVDGTVQERPLIESGILYAAGYQGSVRAMDVATHTERWQWVPKKPSRICSGLSMSQGFLYVGDNRGWVYCISAGDGLVMWRYPTGGPVSISPVPIGGRLLVFAHGAATLCLAADIADEEPALKWKHPDSVDMLAKGQRGLYLLTRDNCVAQVCLDSGEEMWRLPLPADCKVASERTGRTIYLARPSGAIMAITELD